MANNKLKQIQMGNAVLDIVDWYGVCNTSSSTQAKTVSITGFTSNSLFEGTRIVVRFTYAQTYSGTPTLNVNSTGAKNIQSAASSGAVKYEWGAGDIISFIYYNNAWVIENGMHASQNRYGKTILTGYLDNSQDKAMTPQGVTGAVSLISGSWMWDGREYPSKTLVDTTTPSAESWEISGDVAICSVSYSDISSTLNNFPSQLRLVHLIFGDYDRYLYINFKDETSSIYVYMGDLLVTVIITAGSTSASIQTTASYAGNHAFKMILYDGGGADIITYPLLKAQGYLTLADLPIYDGTVV